MLNKRDIRTFSMLGSRRTFWLKITEAADENLIVMTADLGKGNGLEKFQQNFPEQFLNVGIAEQNMIGIAAGLSKVGLNVFATTFSTFITSRCFDQVRVNLGYMNLPVKLVGRGSGICNGVAGATHYAVEDFALMRTIPEMIVVAPADALETAKVATAAVTSNSPMYIRLTDGVNIPMVYKEDYNFELGKANVLREGEDLTIFATGSMVYPSLKAAELLAEKNISAAVVNFHTIKPLDYETLEKYSAERKFIFTVEEHSEIGGLSSAVAEFFADKISPPQIKIALPDSYVKAGEYNFLLDKYGLTAESICAKITQRIQRN